MIKFVTREQAEELCREVGQEYPRSGFGLGQGWFPHVHAALHAINQHIGADWKLLQVKQKFGSLRIYLSCEDEEKYKVAQSIIRTAEDACWDVCENCGAPNELHPPPEAHMGLRTGCMLCPKCR